MARTVEVEIQRQGPRTCAARQGRRQQRRIEVVAIQRGQAVPGAGLKIPLWILGSSTFGAQMAAVMGLPYAFASHFAPDALLQALAAYHQRFRASE